MILKTLEMQGFKSFPDKTVLSFGRGITAVVGPNGSGKSNISDAVRWVLGETSTKNLRGSKIEDVVFGGTSTRKPVGFAQVRLTLDNSDKTLKDKGDTVTVSRCYYRSGDSEYKIDGEVVRLRDVRELFMDTGLGADGYSIVGQGKIDSIISAKNEDRRELFEEAAGISRFRHKRTDAQRRLDQAQENLVRLLDILGELESRVGPLKAQSEKAAQFIKLSDEKKTLDEKSGPGVDVVESQEVLPLKTIRHQDTEDACKEDTSVVPVHQKMMVLQPEGLSGTANTISVALGLGEAGMHEPVPMEGSGHAGTSVTSASDDSVSSGEERD